MLTKLQRHLDKTQLSYKQAITEIMTCDNLEPIQDLLGDFILVATSVIISRPIIVVKPTIERKQDANLMPVTNYYANVDYLFHETKKQGRGLTFF